MNAEQPSLFGRMQCLSDQGVPFVVCTMVSTMGHAPQDAGAKAIVTIDGLHAGTIGGGKIESRAIREALALLRAGAGQLVLMDWDLQRDIGMSCGGSVRVLLEVFGANPWNIYVFGAGHVAQALTRLLLNLQCHVTCIDTRSEWIERLPTSNKLRVAVVTDMPTYAADVPHGSFCAVMTMGHSTDLPILNVLLRRDNLPYIGSIGSKVKARALRADLMRAGLSTEALAKLYCPIGIDIGSHIPEEIAVSIGAQLIQCRAALGNRSVPGSYSESCGSAL